MSSLTLLFVHGTGVRDASFVDSFARVKSAMHKRAKYINVEPCYWGEACGSKLNMAGASIPQFDQTRSAKEQDKEAARSIRWQLLYQDPLYELRLLASRSDVKPVFSPGRIAPGEQLRGLVAGLTSTEAIKTIVRDYNIDAPFCSALAIVTSSPEYAKTLDNAPESLTEYREAIARAVCAQMCNDAESIDWQANLIATDAEARDAIVAAVVSELGGVDMGITSWLTGLVVKPIAFGGTRMLQRIRGAISDAASPAAGDILLYQAHGEGVRAYVKDAIAKVDGAVVVLAHSLGGIACLELLATEHLSNVTQLITYGSQAPLLYELNALRTLPFGTQLPDHFPKWTNIYDHRDFLSYIGAAVFPGKVEDYHVDNQQPFPQSHCAYLGNTKFWDVVLQSMLPN